MAQIITSKDISPRHISKPRWPSRDELFQSASKVAKHLREKPPELPHFGLISFILIVALPTLVAIVYFTFLASDQYLAEARFAVRSLRDKSLASDFGSPTNARDMNNPLVPNDKINPAGNSSLNANQNTGPAAKSLGALSGLVGSNDDRDIPIELYGLLSFIQSRNMVAELNKNGDLRTTYSRPEVDWLSRFDPSSSSEALLHFWRGKVTPSLDAISGIITLRVLAFRPEDALTIANDVINISRQMLDDYSLRLRKNAITDSLQTLTSTSEKYENSLIALRDFRSIDRNANPVEAAAEKIKALVGLEAEQALAERDQWISARLTSPDSITTRLLGERIASLKQQVEKLRAELTEQKGKARTASVAIGQYSDLELSRTFAQSSYAIAQAAFQQARFEAEYKGITLAVFMPPQKPEMALYPRRNVNILLVAAIALIAWAIVRLIAAIVAEYVIMKF